MTFAPGRVEATHGASLANVPTEIVQLAQKLTLRHGDVMVAKEASGFHLYFASPRALEQYGIAELSKKHLALNADKHLGLGAWRRAIGT